MAQASYGQRFLLPHCLYLLIQSLRKLRSLKLINPYVRSFPQTMPMAQIDLDSREIGLRVDKLDIYPHNSHYMKVLSNA